MRVWMEGTAFERKMWRGGVWNGWGGKGKRLQWNFQIWISYFFKLGGYFFLDVCITKCHILDPLLPALLLRLTLL